MCSVGVARFVCVRRSQGVFLLCVSANKCEGTKKQIIYECSNINTTAHRREICLALRFVVSFPQTATCIYVQHPHFLLTHHHPNGLLMHDSFPLFFDSLLSLLSN